MTPLFTPFMTGPVQGRAFFLLKVVKAFDYFAEGSQDQTYYPQ